jgi:hypothetical protein
MPESIQMSDFDQPLNNNRKMELYNDDISFFSKICSCFCYSGIIAMERDVATMNPVIRTYGERIILMTKIKNYFKNPWIWIGKISLLIFTILIITSIVFLAKHQQPICSNVTLQITDISYFVNKPDVIVYNNIKLYDSTDRTSCNITFTDQNRFVITGYTNNAVYDVGNYTDLIKCTDNYCSFDNTYKNSADYKRQVVPVIIVFLCIILLIVGGFFIRFAIVDYKLYRKLQYLNNL